MKIILHRSKCIGCGSCAAICPSFFEMAEDGLSHLKGSIVEQDNEILSMEENKICCAKEAVEICPVQVIEIM